MPSKGKIELIKVEKSSGNVFADLGLPEPEVMLRKADLASAIVRVLKVRGLNQPQAAQILRIDQPKVSALIRGRLMGFSLERLIGYLSTLDQHVEITVSASPRPQRSSHIHSTRVHEHSRQVVHYLPAIDISLKDPIHRAITPRPASLFRPGWVLAGPAQLQYIQARRVNEFQTTLQMLCATGEMDGSVCRQETGLDD